MTSETKAICPRHLTIQQDSDDEFADAEVKNTIERSQIVFAQCLFFYHLQASSSADTERLKKELGKGLTRQGELLYPHEDARRVKEATKSILGLPQTPSPTASFAQQRSPHSSPFIFRSPSFDYLEQEAQRS